MVVTGPPGCGKSAVVGRGVSLSNQQERARILAGGPLDHDDVGLGTINAHLHARGLTAEEVVRELDDGLTASGTIPPSAGRRNRGALHGAIEDVLTCPVIVIDGLD